MNIYSINGDWAKIRYESYYRYVHKGFLSLSMLGEDQLAGRTIVLDPGHGGTDSGASGFGLVEKEIILDVGLRLRKMLEAAGINVVMTRDKDVFLTLDERVDIAKNVKADSFISIHANAHSEERANGTETFWNSYFTSDQSEALAKEIQEELLFLLNTYDRGLKQANFRVIKQTPMPSVLVELAFVTNQSDAEDMAKAEFRDKAAQAIYQGIVNYYNKSN